MPTSIKGKRKRGKIFCDVANNIKSEKKEGKRFFLMTAEVYPVCWRSVAVKCIFSSEAMISLAGSLLLGRKEHWIQ
jgi:hypothetical protein